MTAACPAPAFLPGHFLPGCGTGAGRSDEVPVPGARQNSRDQTGDLAAQTQISDQGPSVRGLDSCALDPFKENLVGLGALVAVRSIQSIIWMQKNKEVLYYHRRSPALGPRFLYLR